MSSIQASAAQALVPVRRNGTDLTDPIRTADDLAVVFLVADGRRRGRRTDATCGTSAAS